MTSAFEKTNPRQTTDAKIETLYEAPPMRVFRVVIKQGRFIVIDYNNRGDKNSDTEVFWESGVIKILPHTSEYKIVDKVINNYVKNCK